MMLCCTFQRAAHDDLVSEIGISIYRVSHDSPIVAALTQAAQEGKHVVALVEIKARFENQQLEIIDTYKLLVDRVSSFSDESPRQDGLCCP